MKLADVSCMVCNLEYPSEGTPYCCPRCGGLFDFKEPFSFNIEKMDRGQPGIWRFRRSFSIPVTMEPVSLGEGNTPLIWCEVSGRRIAFKCEYLNPSGSFKDRGSALIVTWLKCNGVSEAIEDSSGNAGASFAAYSARASIKARILVPFTASGPKRRQIEAYGADLFPIKGSRTDVAAAARVEADHGVAYGSHAYLPFNLQGYATVAYEIEEELGQMPGAVIMPAGQGGLLLGIKRGFDALRIAKQYSEIPRIIGVQALACPPLWAKYAKVPGNILGINSLAEGVQVPEPLRKKAVLEAVVESGGRMCVVDEDEILPSRDHLARLGFYVEPTSALAWAVIPPIINTLPDPVVVILTGSGLKYG